MNLRHDIDELASALLPPYEQRKDWPDNARDTTDRLFAIIVGMSMANQLTNEQLKKLVNQLDGQHRASSTAIHRLEQAEVAERESQR